MQLKMLKPTTYKGIPRKIGDVLEVDDEATARRWIDRKIAEDLSEQIGAAYAVFSNPIGESRNTDEEVPVIPMIPETVPMIVSEAFDSLPLKATTKKGKK